MSKGDNLFNKLKYKSIQNEETIWFQKKENELTVKDIIFMLEEKEISIKTSFYSEEGTLRKTESTINMEELEAIYIKCKELSPIRDKKRLEELG